MDASRLAEVARLTGINPAQLWSTIAPAALDGRFEIDQFDTPDARYLILLDPDDLRHRASARLLPTSAQCSKPSSTGRQPAPGMDSFRASASQPATAPVAPSTSEAPGDEPVTTSSSPAISCQRTGSRR